MFFLFFLFLAVLAACPPTKGGLCDDSGGPTEEVCNGLDDDCDGAVDEDVIDAPIWYPDDDGDDYGDESVECEMTTSSGVIGSCDSPGPGYTMTSGDCDDTDPYVGPQNLVETGGGADGVEIVDGCTDGVDNDCDGLIDADDADDCPPVGD